MSWVEDDGTDLTAARARSSGIARRWRDSAAYRAVIDTLDTLDPSDPDAAARAVETFLASDGPIADLLDPLNAALAQDRWFEPPLRASRDALRIGAGLLEHPRATISASVLSAHKLAMLPPAASAAVTGRITVTRYVRSGGATLRRWAAEPAARDFSSATAGKLQSLDEVALSDGMVVRVDGRTQAIDLIGATSDVVTVTIALRVGVSPFQREYALPSGALLRVATTDDGAARTQMLLTYLRHARRADAAPWFDAATRDGAFFLRWAAMREWLALDVAKALPRLREMTADGNAEIRSAAAQTVPIVEAACRA